ncbi:hypothetical protein NMA1156 [Neisseria meningitidis Z2491]|uniref:Uncharacterized protein n=1 Tax=Neisseria meningitidis serogroup A / serotype 4A (strain DSM 15465 / Z2491) TaxID=122587 RepID=A0A0U1RIK2_NEIMA|nr:hypothetical protein [Neisseria meningitidis]CAM08362.1 hypothetical protein NMA1156 [Neisseria meningitidis Z2491]
MWRSHARGVGYAGYGLLLQKLLKKKPKTPLKRLKKKQKTQRKMPKKLLKTLKKKLNNSDSFTEKRIPMIGNPFFVL